MSTAHEIDQWVTRACGVFGIDPTTIPVGSLLTMTKRVAHEAIRPGAPLSCFIAGIAVGQGLATDADEAITRITALLDKETHPQPPGSSA